MKITSLETFLVAPRWLFLRIGTDEGLAGWGEPVLEGRAETVRAAVAELSEYLIGEDPLRLEHHWQVLTKGGFYRGGPVLSSAVAGIDQALWDLAGKTYGVPVHQLLGGPVRERARVYAWIGGDRPTQVAELAAEQVEAGFTAVKMNGSAQMRHIDTPAATAAVTARVAAVREVLGADRDVVVDFHGRMSTAMSRRLLRMLEPLQPLFVEEPVLPENSRDLRSLAESSGVPLAVGERLYSRWDFRDVLPSGIAVAQPDVSHAGGISELRRIAAAAETYDVAMAPHCPLGPIALAASLQVDFATPNFLIQEQSLGLHYNRGNEMLDYLLDPEPLRVRDGHIDRLTGPGLGIEIDEAAVRRADETGHHWRNPVWHHQDGSFAEW
ncbi:Mandelate racemase/muconate lactonizing protein [Catenulispora acidiphila DSM 44928]|uniref:Mandelate racemase/muconate lactonizing protein n=1 Tax=Catenulispora acidiphila (strain DSM 44928 / JCM 14897 / NBRC 102108 / NRRL B-24433 / ID139908) TaxID=479433 RepID=C7Q4S5_CATAD|nr:galactonate dehydratase [Catenulispora acidiphila]ACU73873.1 Mandelate racemase/muconate lactonizing protein [Catenulispora acidiphila DSM 44928]